MFQLYKSVIFFKFVVFVYEKKKDVGLEVNSGVYINDNHCRNHTKVLNGYLKFCVYILLLFVTLFNYLRKKKRGKIFDKLVKLFGNK